MSSIILTGGGTAGHCTPNLALYPYLKRNFDNVYYIGSKTGIEKVIIERTHIPYYKIETAKLIREFTLSNLTIPFKVVKGVKEAGKIIDELKPDIIFSKGGYVALPVILAAKKRKIPVISHESDYTIGLSNKISAKYCKKVLTSFPETADTLKNGRYVGSPLRAELFGTKKEDALKYYNLSGNKPVLLITGGSLGATAINKVVRESLKELLRKYNVIHICGNGNLNPKLKHKGYVQVEFTDMAKAYSASDICISRAGSNTLFELLALNIPTLLIPLPKGVSRGDQVLNAEYFQKKGLVSVLNQNALTKDSLLYNVNTIYNNRNILIRNMKNYGIKDESRNISRIICDYAKNTRL